MSRAFTLSTRLSEAVRTTTGMRVVISFSFREAHKERPVRSGRFKSKRIRSGASA